jgi:hypothetical protein
MDSMSKKEVLEHLIRAVSAKISAFEVSLGKFSEGVDLLSR